MDLRGKFYVGLKLQTFACFVYNASFAVSRCMGRFLLSVFRDAFPCDLTLPITSISPQFEPCVSLVGAMTTLTAALMK